jgi:YHS domain-containing protein
MNQAIVFVLAASLLGGGISGCKNEAAAAATSGGATAGAQGDPTGRQGSAAKGAAQPLNGFDGMPPVGTKAKCPVMGTEFQVTKDTQSSVYKGKTYVFCCGGCKPQFDADPAKYVGS